MQIDISAPKIPSFVELANSAARAPAPIYTRSSSSAVSLLERVFGVDNSGADPLPSQEEIEEIKAERESEFQALASRDEDHYIDGIATGAFIGTGLTVATALGGAPITAAVLLASVAEFTTYAGVPAKRIIPGNKRYLSDMELKETTVEY